MAKKTLSKSNYRTIPLNVDVAGFYVNILRDVSGKFASNQGLIQKDVYWWYIGGCIIIEFALNNLHYAFPLDDSTVNICIFISIYH